MADGDGARGSERYAGAEDFAREVAAEEVARVVGSQVRVRTLEVVQASDTSVVVLATLTGSLQRVVVKVAERGSGVGTDFERSAAVVGLARAAGVLVPAVLAVGTSGHLGPWQYLIQEHVAGLPWRQVRPLLDEEDVDAAHRELAEAVLAIQTVRFDGFGELGHSGRPEAGTLLAAVRRRADRILRERDRERFLELLVQAEQLFADAGAPATLCHDDLHHDNVVFAQHAGRWRLAGVLDWDKAWSGPAESDVARMAFWDDMTGPAFWRVYDEAVPVAGDREQRMAIYQLLWCLEFDDGSSRHADDTADLWHRLITRLP